MEYRNGFTERERKIIKGEPLRALTRREMYLRAVYDKGQEMPKPITEEEIALKYLVEYVRSLKKER